MLPNCNHKNAKNDIVWADANLKLCVTGLNYIENYTCTLIHIVTTNKKTIDCETPSFP